MKEKKRSVYIATKMNSMEHVVRKLRRELEGVGFEIIYDWTEHPVSKPFETHLAEASKAAELMAKAVMQCDIFIVIYDEKGIGFHIETGGALITSIILSQITGQEEKKIYVVGGENDKSVFYFHSSVTRVSNVVELMHELRK